MNTLRTRSARALAGSAIALSLGLALSGCGGMKGNRSLYSVHEPVVERTNYTLDLATGPGGLSVPEQRRLSGWFDAMNLRYGDRVAIDDPLQSPATRSAVEELAARRGIIIGSDVPVTPGYVNAGNARVIITRSSARVPGCPDWSGQNDSNLANATSGNYGCATNSNLAAMIADPEHLIKGDENYGDTVVMSSTKAIDLYREAKPTGDKTLTKQATGN